MLRKLYYISPTNTNPRGRVFWGSLWVLHVINVLRTFVGPLACGITFGKGTLKRIGKAEKARVFSGGVSAYTLGPGGQCPHEWLVAMCCRWPQCPDDVLFSKRRSHSHILK